jgi:hypothetical protein
MGLFKKALLGTGAVLLVGGAAQAADLPTRKAAPVEYVRICDAYGSGFFFIPGTQTCLRISGRVRADYAFVPAQDVFTAVAAPGTNYVGVGSNRAVATQAQINAGQAVVLNPTASPRLFPILGTAGVAEDAVNTWGWEARGRIGIDARTPTPWGVVQAVALLRMARVSGVLQEVYDGTGTGTGSTLEAAFVRFANFTFGAARDNFSFMPSIPYGSGHWASFANGAKQVAYTQTFGGGLSATIALQDPSDTRATGRFSAITPPAAVLGGGGQTGFAYNSFPQLNGRVEWAQGWGELAVMGAIGRVSEVNQVATVDVDETVWSLGAGVKFNLPMLASGSALWLHGAYADGMTEYTTNWSSVKTSAYNRDVGGFVINHPSYGVYGAGTAADPYRVETVKSWNLAALLQHFWTPQWRSAHWVSYGQLEAPAAARSRVWGPTTATGGVVGGGFGDATVWNIGNQLTWFPTRDFEIGVEVIYARVSQDIRFAPLVDAPNAVARVSESNVTGRLRVERNF